MRMKRNKNTHSTNMNKRWNRNKKSTKRYIEYYETIMDPIWTQRWEKDLKRLKVLKKDILALGPIPHKESQVIATTNYFVKFVNLLTAFLDNGQLECAPISKADSVNSLNTILIALVARKEDSFYYLNKAGIGKSVTTNNLYLGLFVPITEEDDIANIQTKKLNNTLLKVVVDFCPFSDWINKRVITFDGYPATISQKTLANLLRESQSIIFEAIDDVLK